MQEKLKNKISYSFNLTVEVEDIDALNHVNNVVYLKWVNEASERHWADLSNDEINTKYFWVCLRHEIDYVGEAYLHDEVKVVTWVGESKGVKSIRHVEIYKEDKLLAKAASTWCLIDIATQKPTRIRKDILKLLEADSLS
ncbi:MAG: acyl-CoA thioesterase [Flavobacteriaceae bacterium]|nr:acyl-CoA thioesterase [Flavobacteriaceae bacterium]